MVLLLLYFAIGLTLVRSDISNITNADCRAVSGLHQILFIQSANSDPCYCQMILSAHDVAHVPTMNILPQTACEQPYVITHLVTDPERQLTLLVEVTSGYIRVYKQLFNSLYQPMIDVLTPSALIDTVFAQPQDINCFREVTWGYKLPLAEDLSANDKYQQVDLYNNANGALRSCSALNADIGILMYASSSSNYYNMTQAIVKFINNFNIGQANNLVSVADMTGNVSGISRRIQFNTYSNASELIKGVQSLSYKPQGGPNMMDAFNNVESQIFNTNYGARKSQIDILIVITDTNSAQGTEDQVIKAAGNAKYDKGITIYAIGLQNSVSSTLLQGISSGNQQLNVNYFIPDSITTLAKNLANYAQAACGTTGDYNIYPLNAIINGTSIDYALYLFPNAYETTCYWQCTSGCFMTFNWQLNNLRLNSNAGKSSKVIVNHRGVKIFGQNCRSRPPDPYTFHAYIHLYSDVVNVYGYLLNCTTALPDNIELPDLPATNTTGICDNSCTASPATTDVPAPISSSDSSGYVIAIIVLASVLGVLIIVFVIVLVVMIGRTSRTKTTATVNETDGNYLEPVPSAQPYDKLQPEAQPQTTYTGLSNPGADLSNGDTSRSRQGVNTSRQGADTSRQGADTSRQSSVYDYIPDGTTQGQAPPTGTSTGYYNTHDRDGYLIASSAF